MTVFLASVRFHEPPAAGLWFSFRKRELLVSDTFTVPELTSPSALALPVVRTQFLGTFAGTPCYAAELASDAEPPAGMQFKDLRALYGRLDEALFAVASCAVQVMHWDRTHQFCGACAAPTRPHDTARARICTNPVCLLEHYPRLSPAIIVAVERGDEILLARSPHFPPGIYSVLAGFVDPGESAEQAVAREVFEETQIRVKNVRYFGSQPWPFPHSLMLGFQADYESGDVSPQAGEIEDARFYRADALPKSFPGNVSIAQWLLHDFLRRQRA